MRTIGNLFLAGLITALITTIVAVYFKNIEQRVEHRNAEIQKAELEKNIRQYYTAFKTAEGDSVGKLHLDSLQLLAKPQTGGAEKESLVNLFDYLFWIAVIILILTPILFRKWLERFIVTVEYLLDNTYSAFVYSKIHSRIDYLESDGSIVSYRRDDHIVKLSLRRNNRVVRVPLEVEGHFIKEKTSSINGTPHFAANNGLVFHTYLEDENVFNKQHHASYQATIANSFTKKVESWIFKTDKYCNLYCIEVVLPKTRKVLDASMFYRQIKKRETRNQEEDNYTILTENDKKDWKLLESAKVICWVKEKHTVIFAQITRVRPTDRYKLVWTLD